MTVHGLDLTFRLPGYPRMIAAALRRVRGGVFAVSDYTAQVAAARGIQTVVVCNGVDLPRFIRLRALRQEGCRAEARHALHLPIDGRLVVTVGRLVPRKGAAWFAEQVLPLLPPDTMYVLAGAGPERERLLSIAAREPRLRVLGHCTDEEVDQLLAAADLFVAPNLPVHNNPEGFGIAPAEAAAAGLPVLVSDLDGLRDMADICGVPTVPAADALAWRAAVMHALNRPDYAAPARPIRDWAEVAGDYVRLFTGVGNA